jgi:hypothetical protein
LCNLNNFSSPIYLVIYYFSFCNTFCPYFIVKAFYFSVQ